ncbi:MAG: hypothetical protein SFU86_12835 [Pirellulaceae bacterium]|nr:hypothetical protein [Pirellulaceae bacterium]
MSDQRLDETFKAREAYFRTLGNVCPDVWAPLVNPTLMGGPSWPALRQGWRDIRSGNSTIIVSDGLSDPFDDEPEPNVGFGIEILAETTDDIDADVRSSWLFHLVYQVSQNAANHGGFRQAIEEYSVFTMEVYSEGLFDEHENEHGRVGLLLGLAAPQFPIEAELPGGNLRVIPVKLLTLPELRYVAEHKQKGREYLCSKFAADGSFHLSSLNRSSVV